MIGAAVAPAFGRNRANFPTRYRLLVEEYEELDTDVLPAGRPPPEFLRKRGASGVAVYWWALLALVVVAIVLGGVSGKEAGIGMALLGLALGLPALQLAASVVAALVMVASVREDKKYQLIQVGKITLGTFAGTVLGIIAMVVLALGFSAFR